MIVIIQPYRILLNLAVECKCPNTKCWIKTSPSDLIRKLIPATLHLIKPQNSYSLTSVARQVFRPPFRSPDFMMTQPQISLPPQDNASLFGQGRKSMTIRKCGTLDPKRNSIFCLQNKMARFHKKVMID